MPEPPDFEQIALNLCLAGDRDGPGTAAIAEQLRQVWNAALDAVDAKGEESLGSFGEWTKRNLQDVLRMLRR
jgi:hypothetical protein